MRKIGLVILLLVFITTGCKAMESNILVVSELRNVSEDEYSSCNESAYPSIDTTMIYKLHISANINGPRDMVNIDIPTFGEMRMQLKENLGIDAIDGKGTMEDTSDEIYYDYVLYIDASEISEDEIISALKEIDCYIDIEDEIGNLKGVDGSIYDLIEMEEKEYIF